MTKTKCGKCAGSGEFTYKNGSKGVCYPCEGTGEVEPREIPPLSASRRSQVAVDLRVMYRNAVKGLLTHKDVFDADGLGWTPAGLDQALDAVPFSREAFRAIGWPV